MFKITLEQAYHRGSTVMTGLKDDSVKLDDIAKSDCKLAAMIRSVQ